MTRCPDDGAQLQPWSDWLTPHGLECPICGLIYQVTGTGALVVGLQDHSEGGRQTVG
jgi:hypothetical protein